MKRRTANDMALAKSPSFPEPKPSEAGSVRKGGATERVRDGAKKRRRERYEVRDDVVAPPARLELTTLRLGGARSIQVSYGGIFS